MGRGLITLLSELHRGVWYAGFAIYAAGVALFSGPGLDHWWGIWAAGGYALAAIAVMTVKGPWGGRLGLAAALAGAVGASTTWLMTREPLGPDVTVVARSGVLLLHHGTPYLPLSALARGGWLAYDPYLPVMALFGLPRALGVPGDTRPWLIAVTFLLLYATFRVTRAGGQALRQERGQGRSRGALGLALFWLASPIMAFPLAMGITDPPVIALTCLALALLARSFAALPGSRVRDRDMVAAALVLGVVCAMKYTAWPALAVIVVLVATREGMRRAARFAGLTLASAAALIVALAPAALRHPASIIQNTVAYPLGLTSADSPAQSPLPGHLLATLGPAGDRAAVVLLALAGLAIVTSVVIAPPRTPAAAAQRIALGLTALFTLSPATRFGYFIYPIALYSWAVLAEQAAALRAGELRAGELWAGDGETDALGVAGAVAGVGRALGEGEAPAGPPDERAVELI